MQLKTTYRQILSIAIPIILGNLFHSIISFTDTIFMGRVGEAELAACGYASMYYMVLAMIGYSCALGAQIIIARRAGQNDRIAIGQVFDSLFYMLGSASILLFLFVLFGSRWLLIFLLPDPDVYDAAIDYLNYRSFGVPFIFMVFALGALFTGLGRTMIIIWSTSAMALINVFLNYGLVFGNFGFPAMGIEGAGIASMVSEIISFVIILVYILYWKYPKQYLLFSFQKPNWPVMKRILNLAGPIILQSVVGALSWFFLFTIIVNYIGKQELAISNVLKIIYTFFALPTWGLAGATNTLVSNILGQGKKELLFPLIKKITVLSFSICAVLMLILYLFPEVILSFFTDDPQLIENYISTLHVVIISLLLISVGNILFRAVTGAGAVKYALKIEVLSVGAYILYTWVTVVLMRGYLPIAWSVEIVYWIILGYLCFRYLKKGYWKKLEV